MQASNEKSANPAAIFIAISTPIAHASSECPHGQVPAVAISDGRLPSPSSPDRHREKTGATSPPSLELPVHAGCHGRRKPPWWPQRSRTAPKSFKASGEPIHNCESGWARPSASDNNGSRNVTKALIGAVAAAIAIVSASLLGSSAGEAHAYPGCETRTGSSHYWCERQCDLKLQNQMPFCEGLGQTPAQTPKPVQTPQSPPTYAPPSMTPVQTPPVKPPPPSALPVQTPKINPPAPGAAKHPALVKPPKGLDAPQQAVAAAKSAPATRIDPANPPPPPTHVDFKQQIQSVSDAHSGNVDVVKVDNQALVRPSHWDYVDYDVYHRPTLYNPLTEAMTFRYFDAGAQRDVYVAAGSRVVLDVATIGLFPFAAVSDSYVASGSFYGGAWIPPDGWSGPPPPDYTPPAPPEVYQDVSAYVPADNQTVQVGQVTVVGHDENLPAGSQDIFMLDDSTLAWGQVNDPSNSAQIRVTKTQSIPGVAPIDNGSLLVALAAHDQPSHSWLTGIVGGMVVGVVSALAVVLVGWLFIRRRRASV
jgi:hypothetical protein